MITRARAREQEKRRRLIIFLRIPAEVWTDALKTIPRRNLVQNIAPACFRLKEICDKNVKCVHVIKKANQFTKNLEEEDPKASQHLKDLEANKCQLADQFKFLEHSGMDIPGIHIREESQVILRHCPDLFNGCEIQLDFGEKDENRSPTFAMECLSQLEKAKPVSICVMYDLDQFIDFWHHPTFQNCNRARLYFCMLLSEATMMTISARIFEWLHKQPNGIDSAAQQVRCMVVRIIGHRVNHIQWLINRCSEDIQHSQGPIDRRPFVLRFTSWGVTHWFDQFRRIVNKSSGEVLLLDRMMNGDGRPINCYRLRRCLAEDASSGPEFYTGMFEPSNVYYDEFMKGTPEVVIR